MAHNHFKVNRFAITGLIVFLNHARVITRGA
jgi:hypothetical protein